MKELLEKLYSGNGKLSLLLLEAKSVAEEYKDDKLIDFINKELNGYGSDKLTDYRLINAEIIGTVQDNFGQIIYRNHPIDFSSFSDEIGLNLETAHIPEGIGFIEDSLAELSGIMVQRPIPRKAVKILNEVFKDNYPHLNLVSASHRFGKAAIQFILTKVRQDLINGIQKLNKAKELKINSEVENKGKIKVFVSYAWEDEDHNDKVISFVDFLRKNGFNASMDRKNSQENSAIDFNEMMISGIRNADKVIIVLSRKYKEKADEYKGGVGTEFRIIFEQLKTYPNKFIFVSFENHSISEITPTAIGGREILDLKKDQDENEFNQLFAKLKSENVIRFSEVNVTTVDVKIKSIKPFRL